MITKYTAGNSIDVKYLPDSPEYNAAVEGPEIPRFKRAGGLGQQKFRFVLLPP